MKGRLFSMMVLFVALALALSLVATLAPDAGAQNSGVAPDGPAKWMRHDIPAAPDLEGACCPKGTNGFTPKTCCITVLPGTIPQPDTEIGSASAASSNPYSSPSRWFCMDYRNP